MQKNDEVFSSDIWSKFFSGRENDGVVAECGVMNGEAGSVGWFFEMDKGWDSITIEANPNCTESINELRPGSKNYSFALSNKNGETLYTLHVDGPFGRMPAWGSIAYSMDFYKRKSSGKKIEQIMVKTKRYDTWIEEENIKHIDLFILDVEGSEINVIESIGDCDVLPEVWVIEDNHIDKIVLCDKMMAIGYGVSGRYQNNTYYGKML